jgi:NAD(P)-dependent dehydrogenase (short-subunit alcohol dehydrogenase family)
MEENLFDMTDKIAVVTGAGAHGGIGHELAVAFARWGADLAICDVDEEGVELTGDEIREIGREVAAARCDVSDPEQVTSFFEAVDRIFGRIDTLVNVPYAFPERVRPHELSLEAWDKTLAVCLTGYFLCSRQAIRRMLRQESGGAILNIGSIAGISALGRGNFPYSVSKAGVHQMTKELAVEYARDGIRVNAILPAQVLTPGFRKGLLEDPRFAGKRDMFVEGIPIDRLLLPQDFVAPALLLCSDAAPAITGVLLPVDGGNLALNAGGSKTWSG